MAERVQRRGRTRKSEPGITPQPETTQVAQTDAPETPAQNPVEQIIHKFIKGVYKEGLDPMQALSKAQYDLFAQVDVVESFQALQTMTALSLEEARERSDQALIDALASKHRSFTSALRRLSPLMQGVPSATTSTNPSTLPPMTGRKG